MALAPLSRNRVGVLHGPNFDQLEHRPAHLYGGLSLNGLQQRIEGYASELGLAVRHFQSNHEGTFVEELHRTRETTDALILNPGAWTHYSWAIRDALELTGLPAVEVHLSDPDQREEWRRVSVIRDLCFATVKGQGVDGYRDALTAVRGRLEEGRA